MTLDSFKRSDPFAHVLKLLTVTVEQEFQQIDLATAAAAILRWTTPRAVDDTRIPNRRVSRELWSLIRETPHLTWQILTKRPQNFRRFPPSD